MVKSTHFISNDARFCGAKEKLKHFTPLDAEVTCPSCLDNAGLIEPTEQPKEVDGN